MVQMALLDLQMRDFDAMAKTIAKIRSKWRDLAAADLLDAQLALAQGKTAAAGKFFDEAIRKDPKNKIALFWKAQLESRTGSVGQAVESLESILSSKTSKLLEPSVPLAAAVDSALAAIEMESGQIDQAIRRIRTLLASSDLGVNARPLRWQLVASYHSKKQWTLGKQELSKLLNDPKQPARIDERICAAAFMAANNEYDDAEEQLNLVFKRDPNSAGAALAKCESWSRKRSPPRQWPCLATSSPNSRIPNRISS